MSKGCTIHAFVQLSSKFSFSYLTNCIESPTKSLKSLLQGTGLDPNAKAIVQATRDMIQDLNATKHSKKSQAK